MRTRRAVRPRWTWLFMRSTACWSWDARATSASPEPGRGWGDCVHTPDRCTTLTQIGLETEQREESMSTDYLLHYLRWHDLGDEHFQAFVQRYVRVLRDMLPPGPKGRALEIGSGMGFTLAALQELGFTEVVGLDVDRGMVELARRRGLPAELIEPHQLVPRITAVAPVSFVVAFDVLEHLPTDQVIPALAAVHEALIPGGRFVCQVPNAT